MINYIYIYIKKKKKKKKYIYIYIYNIDLKKSLIIENLYNSNREV